MGLISSTADLTFDTYSRTVSVEKISVEKSEISFNMVTIYGIFFCILNCFIAKFVGFLAIYAVLSQNWSVAITRFCVEKILAKNSVCGDG